MKNKNIFRILFLIILAGSTLSGDTVHDIQSLLNPSQITIDKVKGEIFIVDGTTIHVFSVTDLAKKKTFGKRGEGPGEFLPPISINANPETLLVNSRNKVSFFSRKFIFIRELKVTSGKRFAKLGDKFAGQGFKIVGQDGYETFNFFNPDFSKGEEIVSRRSPIQRSGKIPVLSAPFIFRVYNDVVYYSFNDKLELGVAHNGKNKLYGIKIKYKNRPFSETDKAAFENYFKTNPNTKRNYEILKQRLEYPDHYPAIRTFLVDEGQIYVLTYKKDANGSSELFIFKTDGELIKKSVLPVRDMNIFRPYPFTISGGKLYQLIETDDEKWKLHIFEI